MNLKKILKTAAAAAVLCAVTAAFFGAPTHALCRIQPAPTLTFLAVLLVVTPVFGRIFCECACPLGIIQSLVNWIFHPKTHVRRVCTRLPESRAQTTVRWTVLALAAVLASTGYAAAAWSVTPYSIFGRALSLFAPGLATAIAIAVLAAVGRGRVWCNWICPAGTLFHLLSRRSLCRHKVGPGCANCRACFQKSAADAAEAVRKESGAPKGDAPQDGITRRETIRGMAVLAAVEAAEKTTDGGYAAVSLPGVPSRQAPVLPPGALERGAFEARCVGCGLCIANCRGGCLAASTELKRFGQPEMDFRNGYCLAGCSRKCAVVCPAGAIRALGDVPRRDMHNGYAVWRRELCIRETDGVQCTACSHKCPAGAIHIVEGFPVVDKDACIGCGACEHVCPARPEPAIYVSGLEKQRIVVPMGEPDLVGEMKSLVSSGEASCVAARDGVIVAKAQGRGVAPALRLLDEGSLAGAVVVDKVVGRAAAAIFAAGAAKSVHAALASADAVEFLRSHGIECTADETVPGILDRNLAGKCPMECAVERIDDPAEMVKALRFATRP